MPSEIKIQAISEPKEFEANEAAVPQGKLRFSAC
jgi:hypothetical protein